tara:strand:+ start:2729 stop:4636 length:1908 start_codon:yes stop_codon:yes gene_type:complete
MSLADINRALNIQDQLNVQGVRTSRSVVDELAPFIEFMDLESEGFGGISKENFSKALGEEVPLEGNDDFVTFKDADRIIRVLNLSPTATGFKDITTGNIEKGEIVGLRKNKDTGAITIDIKGKQGIVPKTLGFSNDPNDIVLALDDEGLRTTFNTILQGQVNNLTSQRAGYGDRARGLAKRQGVELMQAQDKEVLLRKIKESNTPEEAIANTENAAEGGALEPAEAFAILSGIGQAYQAELDKQNRNIGKRLDESRAKQEQAKDRQQDKTVAKKTKFDFGMDAKFPPLQQNTAAKTQDEIQADKDLEAAQKEEAEITARIGAEDQMLRFPLNASAEAQFAFIVNNEEDIKRITGDQNVLDRARAAFNKYKVAEPEDLKKIPKYDAELDINRVEIAAALAVAEGGDDFTKNFQDNLNLLETGSSDVTRLQAQNFDRAVEAENQRLQIQNEANKIALRGITNDAAKDSATRMNKTFGDFIKEAFDDKGRLDTDFINNKGAVFFGQMSAEYNRAKRSGFLQLAPQIRDEMEEAIGLSLYSIMDKDGQNRYGPILNALFGPEDLNRGLGQLTSKARAVYEGNPQTGGAQIKEVYFVNSQGQQVGQAIPGAVFAEEFGDIATFENVRDFILPAVADAPGR